MSLKEDTEGATLGKGHLAGDELYGKPSFKKFLDPVDSFLGKRGHDRYAGLFLIPMGQRRNTEPMKEIHNVSEPEQKEWFMRKSGILALCVLSLTLVATLNLSAIGSITVVNGDFEDSVVNGYSRLPSVPGWTFTEPSGTAAEAGILDASSAVAWGYANSGQVVALYGGGTMSQTIAGFGDGGYQFVFDAKGVAGSSTLTAKLDGVALTFGGVAEISPANIGYADIPATTYTSDAISLSAGSHTLEFISSGWVLIDDVSATNVPEPTCIALLGFGLIGTLTRSLRRRN